MEETDRVNVLIKVCSFCNFVKKYGFNFGCRKIAKKIKSKKEFCNKAKSIAGEYRKWKEAVNEKYGDLELGYFEHTIMLLNRIDENSDYLYECEYQEKYARYDKIRIHHFNAPSIGEVFRGLSIAWSNGLIPSGVNRVGSTLDVLMPQWVLFGDLKNVTGFPNSALYKYIKKHYELIGWENSGLWKYIFEKYPSKIEVVKKFPDKPLLNKGYPFIQFEDSDLKRISQFREAVGLGGSDPFVVVSARDASYYSKIFHKFDNSSMDFRNSSMNAFDKCVAYLHDEGILPIRGGKIVENKYDNPNCVDYPNLYHDDVLDLYLAQNCKFSVGTLSGTMNMSQVMGKPCVSHDVVVMKGMRGFAYSDKDLFIPKKIMDSSGRILGFTEMWQLEEEAFVYNDLKNAGGAGEPYYADHGYSFINNTEDEILEATMEMNQRLDGTWKESKGDLELKEKYRAIRDAWLDAHPMFKRSFYYADCGTSFLRNNSEMLH